MPREESGDRIMAILDGLAATYPEAGCGLVFADPFQLLVATMLSAQCTDKCVNRVTAGLFRRYPDAASMVALGEESLANLIRPCGLAPTKSKNIVETCRRLVKDFAGQVPRDLAALVELPGVGRKTANVVLANAFGENALAVDTHVFRVSHRLGLSSGKTPHVTETELTQLIPPHLWRDAHHQLIAHGRAVCLARRPRCAECTLAPHCPSRGIFSPDA